MFFLSVVRVLVESGEFVDASEVTAVTGRRPEPRVEGIEDDLGTEKSSAEAEHVGVIVFAGQTGRGRVMHQCGPHAGNLVGGNRDTDAGTTDGDAEIGRAVCSRAAHGGTKVGVVHRGRRVVGSEVEDLVTPLTQGDKNGDFEVKSGVVGTYGNSHCHHATRHHERTESGSVKLRP